jgi:hypothetical protein
MGMKINYEFDSHKGSVIEKITVMLDDTVFSSRHLPTIPRNEDKFLTDYLLTFFTQQIPSWEANRFSASQEIPHILWNP